MVSCRTQGAIPARGLWLCQWLAASAAVLLVVQSRGLAATAGQPTTTLWSAYTTYPPCFRQPLVVALDAQRLVAFAEGRNNTYCSGGVDGTNSSIHVRTSPDGGLSWTPSRELLHAPPQPDYLSAVVDPVAGTVLLFVQTSGGNVQLVSKDGGASFSGPAPVAVKLPSGFTATPGVAGGIAVSGSLCAEPTCGGSAGRLVVAWVCHASKVEAGWAHNPLAATSGASGDISCVGCYSCLAVSDDHGATWVIDQGAVSTQEGSREASVAQLDAAHVPGAKGAVIYVSERNMGATPGSRWHALSLDSGDTLSEFGTDPELPDVVTANWTGVVAGLARVGNTLLFSTPTEPGQRANLGVFHSSDDAGAWSSGMVVSPGPSGYSCIAPLNDTHAALVFENGAQEFAEQISIMVVTLGTV